MRACACSYGLGKTPVQQYFKWVWNFVQGNMGQSFIYDRPVNDLIWERLGLTFMIATASLVFTWLLAFIDLRQLELPIVVQPGRPTAACARSISTSSPSPR